MSDINTMDVKETPSHSNEEPIVSISEHNNFSHQHCCDENEKNESSDSSHGASEQHSYIDELVKELEKIPEPEMKVQRVIDFMELSIAQTGSPHFKSFWQARGLCLQLFKENISPAIRSILWNKYTELSKEARRLKDLLDEQSAFAVEQIEIAIQAIENEVSQNSDPESHARQDFELNSHTLKKNYDFYNKIQNELDFLNKQASRINGLRKELIKTDMRIRKKNKFFQRLSQLGDRVFPRRKELIAELSSQFIKDVDHFVSEHFAVEDLNDSLFFLREEIKALQGNAKLLTLNTHSFTQTRMRLSECWDRIKNEEKERKKLRNQQKTAFKENMEAVLNKLEEIKKTIQENQIAAAEANKKFDEAVSFMRTIELGRDEIQYLREQIAAARQPYLDHQTLGRLDQMMV